MPEKYFGAKVSDVFKIARDTFEVKLAIEGDFQFKAGQYIWLLLNELDYDDPRGERRAFSISSSPLEGGNISVVFRSGTSGYKRTLTELSVGMGVTVIGPFGSAFVIDEKYEDSVVMIASGVGVAPFLSVVRYLCGIHTKRRFVLVCRNLSREKTIYLEELEKLDRENERFNYVNLYRDFVWRDIENLVERDRTYFYVAGQQKFVNMAYSELIGAKVRDAQMKFEEYYPEFGEEIGKLLLEEEKQIWT